MKQPNGQVAGHRCDDRLPKTDGNVEERRDATKAIIQKEYGPPDVLELGDIERPEIGYSEVLVRTSVMRNVTSYNGVQQPCSNPSKYPESLGKASSIKYADLQAFCRLRKSSADYRAAFTWQRSLVRTQH